MAEEPELPNLILIVGPTAVGKTAFSIQLARQIDAEVISADSRLLYKGMNIGTAKPSLMERQGVCHHLIDVAEPDELWSLQRFQMAAERAIFDIHQRGHLPLLVGGTGQYVRAVVEGWQGPPVSPNPELREALEVWASQITPEGLHSRLASLDLQAAAGIDPSNLRRTVRALEVIFMSGKRFSEQRIHGNKRFRTLMIGLNRPRQELYQRIDQRIEKMFEAGFLIEVNDLLSRGFARDLPTMSAIGYKEIIEYLQGTISFEEAKARMRHQTRVFVRRQANWFKLNDPNIHWLLAVDPDSPNAEEILLTARNLIEAFIAKEIN
jgi:tRNA dimethylallyltransferase